MKLTDQSRQEQLGALIGRLTSEPAGRYACGGVIGRGSYGVVWDAVDTSTRERVAIKHVRGVFANPSEAARMFREMRLLRLLGGADSWLVSLRRVLLPRDPFAFDDLFLVFERFETDLHTVIALNGDLTPGHHRVLMQGLLRGVAGMHASGVLHRDLKPQNVLVNSDCMAKVADLGLARPSSTGESGIEWSGYIATRWYRAPELIGRFSGTYTGAMDIWSVGCIFAELLLRRPLFGDAANAPEQLAMIVCAIGKPSDAAIDAIPNAAARNFLHKLPPSDGSTLAHVVQRAGRGQSDRDDCRSTIDLLRQLLVFDPKQRISARRALAHPYFAALLRQQREERREGQQGERREGQQGERREGQQGERREGQQGELREGQQGERWEGRRQKCQKRQRRQQGQDGQQQREDDEHEQEEPASRCSAEELAALNELPQDDVLLRYFMYQEILLHLPHEEQMARSLAHQDAVQSMLGALSVYSAGSARDTVRDTDAVRGASTPAATHPRCCIRDIRDIEQGAPIPI